MSNAFLLSMTIGAYAGQRVRGTSRAGEKDLDVHASVEVLELPLRKSLGSKGLVKGTGGSCRKYSSGV